MSKESVSNWMQGIGGVLSVALVMVGQLVYVSYQFGRLESTLQDVASTVKEYRDSRERLLVLEQRVNSITERLAERSAK